MAKIPPKKNQQDSGETQVEKKEAPAPEPEKDLFVWKAQSRPFKKRSREYWITVVSIASLLAFILFLAEGVMPVILISSLIFLYYIMSTVNPEEIEYKITNFGIKIADKTTPWFSLSQFWFTKRMDSDILAFETTTFPGRLEIVINSKDIPKLKEVLSKYLPEGEFLPTRMDKAVDWVAKKLPSN